MKPGKQSLFITILLFLVLTNSSLAQDGHYWTQQYGTRSMLLSGSIIGGVDDLGAVYYNPARLSQISNPAFLLSADVYEWNTLKIEDAFGNNKNASKSDFGGVPSLAAGTFKIGFLKNHYFAWAIINRQNQDLNIGYKDEVYDDVIENFPGQEYFGAEIIQSAKANVQWMSLSWAYPLNEKWSIGASGYFSIIDNNKGNTINLQALAENGQVAIYRFRKAYSFNHYNLLGKLGLSYQSDKAILGLTVLTASLKLSGKGNYQNEFFFSGIEGVSESEDVYVTSYQNDLETKYRSPWAIGAGLTYFIGKSRIHFSTEWYSAVPKYTIMEAANYLGQSNDSAYVFKMVDEFKSVINAGVGVRIHLNEKIAFYTSFSTDFSAVTDNLSRFAENDAESYNSVFKSNFFNYGGGFVLDMKGADITLGATYTGAKLTLPRPFTFPENEDDDIFASDEHLTAKWNRWRIVFSFSLPFLKDVQKKAEAKFKGKDPENIEPEE